MNIEYFTDPKSLSHTKFLEQLTYFDWDVKINGKEYDVYLMQKCYHCQGGRGDNNLWIKLHSDPVEAKYFREFSDSSLNWLWGIFIEPKLNFAKHGARTFFDCWITRNGEKFYEINGGDFDYCLTKARYYITKLTELTPFSFHEKNYIKDIIGREILWYTYPAIITDFYRCRITFKPDQKKMIKTLTLEEQKEFLINEKIHFPAPLWKQKEFNQKYEEDFELVTDIFDKNIEWYPK